jgi:hypothetical protein
MTKTKHLNYLEFLKKKFDNDYEVVKGLKEVLVFFSLESYIGEKIVWGS